MVDKSTLYEEYSICIVDLSTKIKRAGSQKYSTKILARTLRNFEVITSRAPAKIAARLQRLQPRSLAKTTKGLPLTDDFVKEQPLVYFPAQLVPALSSRPTTLRANHFPAPCHCAITAFTSAVSTALASSLIFPPWPLLSRCFRKSCRCFTAWSGLPPSH